MPKKTAQKAHDHNHPAGCEFCGDFPKELILNSRCHTTAPLLVSMSEEGILTLRCYIPECAKVVAQFKVDRNWRPSKAS